MEDDKVHTGLVIFFSSKLGYGFLKPDDNGADLFIHFSDINCEGFKTVAKDQRVSYQIGLNKRSQPKAINVTVIK